jgi:protein-S-isoprenylcysteine O-methyltransferase Ste14
MFVLLRAVTYATLFVGVLLVFLPARILLRSGIQQPLAIGVPQVVGMAIGATGAALALSCILTFVFVGKGTPAPFDAPRRLVDRGPYRTVRNPMYLGAGLALGGAGVFYQSFALLVYAGLFMLVTHLFVVFYEEPALSRSFGHEYDVYCRDVSRWWPGSRKRTD